MSASPTQPDRLFLTDAFVPRLTAGTYTLTAKQALMVEKEPGEPVEVASDTKKFSVAAPRFSLDPDEIYSVYPADGSSGAYESTVPHVVFRRKTLPWERKFQEGTGNEAPPPWMALLLFHEDELPKDKDPFETCLIKDLVGFKLDPWDENPRAGPSSERNNRCKTLSVPWTLFTKVAPQQDELRYLAHTRGVFTKHKEDVPGIGDGWFSVILANRLPIKHDLQSKVPPKRNIAVLISLEGLTDLIKPNPPSRSEPVRLVVLATWSFVSTGPKFADRVKALYYDSENKTQKGSVAACSAACRRGRGSYRAGNSAIPRCRTTCDREAARFPGIAGR